LGAALPLPQTDKAAAISPAPAVVVLRGTSAIGEIVPAWDELAGAALEPNPFYESWMLRPAIEHLAAGQDIQLVTVWAGDKLGALLPVQRQRRYKGLPIRTLRAWRHRHCLLGTPLVRAEGAATYVAALVEWFRKAASVVELDYLPADGPVYRLLTRTPLAAVPWEGYERALFRRARDADTYVATAVSRQDRQEVRRRERRLAERGAVAHVTLRPGDSLERWLGELLQLEAGGWKGKQGSALACSESNRRFATEIFTAAYRRGRLHMVGLDLDGKPLARHIMISAGDGSFSFKLAYDETHARSSPGILAEVDNVRQFLETPGLRYIDSNTARQSTGYGRVWKDRRTVQRVAIGVRGAGHLALVALPLMRLVKRWTTRKKPVAAEQPPTGPLPVPEGSK
jgi:CelD/BcsL family acetyltransferase involved in cellulose biosynthesis